MPQATVNALIVDSAGNAVGGGGVVGTPVSGTSGNVANAIATASLAAAAGKTNYVTAVTFTAAGSTAGLAVQCTLGGLAGAGTLGFTFVFPVGVLVPAQPLLIIFDNPIPASAANIAIVATLPASGAGGTSANVSIVGFQL